MPAAQELISLRYAAQKTFTNISYLNCHSVEGFSVTTIYAAASACGKADVRDAKIVRISNTLELDEIWVSENYLPEVKESGNMEILDEPGELAFDSDNNLLD